MTAISLRSANTHNLKNVDLSIPRERLVVVTGPSGSGKTSLAFDTLFAESQRRYLDSLSSYARMFLDVMPKPDVEAIDGLSPAVAIQQKSSGRNPRSTVGTVTEIHDYLRLLYAGIGVPLSPATNQPMVRYALDEMVNAVLAIPDGTRLQLLAPMPSVPRKKLKGVIQTLQRSGYQRVILNGQVTELEDADTSSRKDDNDIEVIVDRFAVGDDMFSRLAASFETTLRLSGGRACIEFFDETDAEGRRRRQLFSEDATCPVSGFTVGTIEPKLFSFNNPAGACPSCGGLGSSLEPDPDLVIPDPGLSLHQGAIEIWQRMQSNYYAQVLQSLASHAGFSTATPWRELPPEARHLVLWGTGKTCVEMNFSDGSRSYQSNSPFEGVIPALKRRHATAGAGLRELIERYMADTTCPHCQGRRLRPEALAVKIDDYDLGTLSNLPVHELAEWVATLPDRLSQTQKSVAARLLKEIGDRLAFLLEVGLGYLSLSRGAATLSGGESQRIRLASQIGSGLVNVLYVLDEPSIGLHQRDNARLISSLKKLRDLGNSVIVVEHDEDTILAADYVIDIGPGAGTEGGHVIAAGEPGDIVSHPESLTGKYLSGRVSVPMPATRRQPNPDRMLSIEGATGRTLKDVTMQVPLGLLVAVTGVSGSGKSTMVMETIYKTLARRLNGARVSALPIRSITGVEHFDQVVRVDQSPIGRTPRSNPATYIGLYDHLRDWFAALPESKSRGYDARRFSFNVPGGRCTACEGDGLIRVDMHFLPDVFVTCDACKGKRFGRETLEVNFKGKSIADILDTTIDDAAELFSAVPTIRNRLRLLQDVGLGYMKGGQPATTLSGGEAQRIKLAKELTRRSRGRSLYVFDEPTTGLHFNEVAKLVDLLHRLVEGGNTVLVIEHNLDLIRSADWVIDFGPEGGVGGGRIIAQGSPEDVAKVESSFTGIFLAKHLAAKAPR